MPRTVTLVVFHFPQSKAHCGLFLPHSDNENVGTLIHTSGDLEEGCEIQFTRNYNLKDTRKAKSTFEMPQVADGYITDVKGNGNRDTDKIARNEFERIVTKIEAPGPRLQSDSNTKVSESSKPKTVNLRTCQDWLKEVVKCLEEHGAMASGSVEVIKSAPKF